MAIEIESGTGNGNKMGVDGENRGLTFAVTEPEDKHINITNGKVWSIPFEGLNPAGADDYVCYIKKHRR